MKKIIFENKDDGEYILKIKSLIRNSIIIILKAIQDGFYEKLSKPIRKIN